MTTLSNASNLRLSARECVPWAAGLRFNFWKINQEHRVSVAYVPKHHHTLDANDSHFKHLFVATAEWVGIVFSPRFIRNDKYVPTRVFSCHRNNRAVRKPNVKMFRVYWKKKYLRRFFPRENSISRNNK